MLHSRKSTPFFYAGLLTALFSSQIQGQDAPAPAEPAPQAPQIEIPGGLKIEIVPNGANAAPGKIVIQGQAKVQIIGGNEDAEAPKADAVPWLGIQMEQKANLDFDEDEMPPPGVGVLEAVADSPALKAGLKRGDRILKIGKTELKDEIELRTEVRSHKAGDELSLTVLRDEKEMEIKVTLEAMPEQQLLGFGGGFMLQGDPNAKPTEVYFYGTPSRISDEKSIPDSVNLSDGNRLTGQILDLTPTELKLKLDGGPEVVLDASKVVGLRSGTVPEKSTPAYTLALRQGGVLAAGALSMADGKWDLTPATGGNISLPQEAVSSVVRTAGQPSFFYQATAQDTSWLVSPLGSWQNKNGIWETDPNRGGGSLARKFPTLPDGIELSFCTTAKMPWGFSPFSVTLFGQRLSATDVYGTPGSVNLDLTGNGINVMHFDGQRYHSNMATVAGGAADIAKPAPGTTIRQVRIFCRRSTGLLIVTLDGREAGRYQLGKVKPEDLDKSGRVLRLRANAGGMDVWNLQLRPWIGDTPPPSEGAPGEAIILTNSLAPRTSKLTSLKEGTFALANGQNIPPQEAVTLEFLPIAKEKPTAPPASTEKCWVELKNGSAFGASNILISAGGVSVDTPFAKRLTFPLSQLRSAQYVMPNDAGAATAGLDTLTFKDGRQLKGKFGQSGRPDALQWNITAARSPLEFPVASVAGLLLTHRGDAQATAEGPQVIRLVNGDWICGEMTALDADTLTFKTAVQGALTIPRALISELFPAASASAVADGGSGRAQWKESGPNRGTQNADDPNQEENRSHWKYADGSYALQTMRPSEQGGVRIIRGSSGSDTTSGIAMPLPETKTPMLVEFTAVTQNTWLSLNFTDKSNSTLLTVYRMGDTIQVLRQSAVRDNGRILARPEQFQFNLGANNGAQQLRVRQASEEVSHLQFVIDPLQERLHISCNGKALGNCFLRNEFPWQSLRKILFSSASFGNGFDFKVSNVWIAPWNGLLGEPGKAAQPADQSTRLYLANGDETKGTLKSLTGGALEMVCDAGEFPIPPSRVLSAQFHPMEKPQPGLHRIRLFNRGLISAKSIQMEADKLRIETALGSWLLPLEMIKEVVFPS